MSDVMTFSKRTAAGLEEVLRALLLDSENKVPADRLRIVGALSAGNIIESGSNANGEYVRWADGTQICTGAVTITLESTENYKTGVATYPASFYAVPTVVSGTYQGSGSGLTSDVGASSVSTCTITVSPARGTTFGTVTEPKVFTYIAIGRWKA
ncbi:hypothetical protein [uncultured Cloacibacillus sp.]|uniref:hypothetical protein n=1 Tax=uncultured Cloacibacillus sp. TaxID=889794 RepID=UPI0025EA70BC|nr:hypothetical protein [uncultured Cloacibacillus sp.]